MPPKIQPRRQQPARGAGRAKVAEEPQKESVALDNNQQNVSLGSETGASDQSPSQDVAQTPQPASTAAAAAGPPRRRLASLHLRKKGGSNATSEVSDSRSVGLKYQPKPYVRPSKAEREATEKAVEERKQSRLAEGIVPTSSSGGRGGFHGRGVRGLYSGGMNRFSSREASGHLGGSSVSERGRKKSARGGGLFSRVSIPSESTKSGSLGLKMDSTVKPEKDKDGDVVMGGATARKRQAIKQEERGPTYISSDEESDATEGPRVNIEHINLISDDDTDTEKPEASNHDTRIEPEKENKIPAWNLKPIRIDRHEHVERAVAVAINTDASSLTSAELRRKAKERGDAEGSLFLADNDEPEVSKTSKVKRRSKPKDIEFLRNERRWKGVYQDDDDQDLDAAIKLEPKDDDPMILDDLDRGDAPETSLAADSEAVGPEVTGAGDRGDPSTEDAISLQKQKRSQTTKSKLTRPVLQTEEDRQEWARYEEDLRILGEELGPIKTDADTVEALGEDGKPSTENDSPKEIKDKREGLVYLFQLPPIMPQLLTAAEMEILHKPKQEDKPSEQKDKDKKPRTYKSAATDSKPKSEHTEPLSTEPKSPHAFTAPDPSRPVGCVGKLRVYDSGRVMATWGGASLEVGRSGEGGLLQEVLMTDYERTMVKIDEGAKEKGKERWEEQISLGKNGWAVGQLAGGFVMVPDWARMVGG